MTPNLPLRLAGLERAFERDGAARNAAISHEVCLPRGFLE